MEVKAFAGNLQAGGIINKGTSPVLEKAPDASYTILYGDEWTYSFKVTDPENDL